MHFGRDWPREQFPGLPYVQRPHLHFDKRFEVARRPRSELSQKRQFYGEQCLVSRESQEGRYPGGAVATKRFTRPAEPRIFNLGNLGNIFAAEAGSKWPFNTIQQDFCANIQIVIRIMMLIWMMVNKARAGRKRVKCRIQQRVEADCCHLLVFHLPPVLHKPHFLHRTFCRSVHTFTSVCTHCMMPAHKCMYAAVFTRCLLTHSPFSSLARN